MKNSQPATNIKNHKLKKKQVFSIATFALLFQMAIFLNKSMDLSIGWRVVLGTLPVVPFVLSLIYLSKSIKQDDEMFFKIAMDSFMITGLITLSWTLAVGLFQQLEVLPNFSLYFVPFVMMFTFSIVYLIVMKKYQ
jgi:hypothetical protein